MSGRLTPGLPCGVSLCAVAQSKGQGCASASFVAVRWAFCHSTLTLRAAFLYESGIYHLTDVSSLEL